MLQLGTTYEDVLLNLTTLPYWLTFTASPEFILPGTLSIPAPELPKRVGRKINTIGTLGNRKHYGQPLEARYCPKCLTDDYNNLGITYWHRAHQLPNVYFCHKHHCELRVNCPDCGTRAKRGAKQLVSLLTPNCECGTKLHAITSATRPTLKEVELIKVSTLALTQGRPTWNRSHVVKYFQDLLGKRPSKPRRTFHTILTEAFPVTGEQTSRLRKFFAMAPNSNLIFRKHLSTASAPEFCGLLAAFSIELDDAVSKFRFNASNGVIFNSKFSSRTIEPDLEYSRQFLLNAKIRFPSRAPSSNRKHYWQLRVADPQWLFMKFPECSKTPLPNIASDRIELRRRLLKAENASQRQVIQNASGPGVRSKIRDSQWLKNEMKSFAQVERIQIKDVQKEIVRRRIMLVTDALRDTLEKEQKPARIFAPMLAKSSGLSVSQTGDVIRSHASLRAAIDEANRDKKRRQLLWAGQQLCVAGKRLSKTQIGKQAGLPGAEVSNEVLQEILSRCSAQKG